MILVFHARYGSACAITCQGYIYRCVGSKLLGASKLSGIVAHYLSGLRCHDEVTNETVRVITSGKAGGLVCEPLKAD